MVHHMLFFLYSFLGNTWLVSFYPSELSYALLCKKFSDNKESLGYDAFKRKNVAKSFFTNEVFYAAE